jgi:hypothetical protein
MLFVFRGKHLTETDSHQEAEGTGVTMVRIVMTMEIGMLVGYLYPKIGVVDVVKINMMAATKMRSQIQGLRGTLKGRVGREDGIPIDMTIFGGAHIKCSMLLSHPEILQ